MKPGAGGVMAEIRQGPTAVYRWYDDAGALLYAGTSNNPLVRAAQHSREKRWWEEVARCTVVWFPTRPEALAVEREANRTESPKYLRVGQRPGRAVPREGNALRCGTCGLAKGQHPR